MRNIEGLARAYKDFNIDSGQSVRLFLIAPSFSISLINRCKWIDIPISLFTYKCLLFEDSEELTPVFLEVTIPSAPKAVEIYTVSDRLQYITDLDVRKTVDGLIEEIQSWDPSNIQIEPTKYDISLKISGRVFSYIGPRRKFFVVYTYDKEGKWTAYPIHQKEDLVAARTLLKTNVGTLA